MMNAAHNGQPGQPYENCACKSKRCKAYSVVIELELQRVTCPGVWLCNNGKVTIQIFLLGLCTQTSAMTPNFPLLCNEKFIFRKNFANIQNLVDIDRKLDKEIIYMELIQWEDCMSGNVLATFKTTLNDLLYPFPCDRGVVAGVNVDLLMEATRIFPGIIAPKIEVSTKLTIEEVLCSLKQESQNDILVINPKLISSKCAPRRNTPMRQKKVCHNTKYHNLKSSQSPDRTYSKKRGVKSLRSSFSNSKICNCTDDKTVKTVSIKPSPSCSPNPPKCSKCANDVACNLCNKYKNYFSDMHEEPLQEKPIEEEQPGTVTQYKTCKCNKLPKPKPSNSWKEPDKEKISTNKGTSRGKADKIPSGKGNKKEVVNNVCACDGDTKPTVCRCKPCKECDICEEKKSTTKTTQKPIPKSAPKPTPMSTPMPTPISAPQYTPRSTPTTAQKPRQRSKPEVEFNLPRASSTPLSPTRNPMYDSSCNQTFYRNLEHFYKQLYLRAHHKLNREMCKCEGE